MDSKKYKEEFKKVGLDILNDLEPIIKKGFNSVMDFFKEIVNDGIAEVFEKNKKKINKETKPENNKKG